MPKFALCITVCINYWILLAEVESRTQGSRPRPRTQKKSEAKAKDSLSEDRHSQGQGQECSSSRPRTQAQVLSQKKKVFTKIFQAISKKKKKVFKKFFQTISTKKPFLKNFSTAPQNFNNSINTAVLEPRTGRFSRTWGLEAKDFKMCPRGRPPGLHLWLLGRVNSWTVIYCNAILQ